MSEPSSPLTEIGAFLQLQGLGLLNVDLFLGSRPDRPDTLLSVVQYPGDPPEYVQDVPTPHAESLQIQVTARSKSYAEAESKAYTAWRKLAGVRNITLGETRYRGIYPNHSPALMGRDESDRVLVFFNATVEKEAFLG